MKNIVIALALGIASSCAVAQAPAAKPVTPKAPYNSIAARLAVQTAKNDLLQANALDLDKVIARAVEQYNQQQAALKQEFDEQQKIITKFQEDTREANGWDGSYVWDHDTDTWSRVKK